MDYLHYITQSRIVKKSNIQVNIPTYNSYEVTKATIQKLYQQKDITIDVLLIDNNTKDYEKLMKDFPSLNYVLLKDNTGSGGSQRIGIEVALKHEYEYVICTDNDALLLDDYGLSKMYKKITTYSGLGCVVPNNIEINFKKDMLWNRQLPVHYVFVRTEVLKKIELPNFYLFMTTDDVSLVSKIVSNSKLLICSDVLFFHEIFKPKFLSNYSFYFLIRGFLAILFWEKNISLGLKFRHFLHLGYKVLLCITFSIQLWDFSYLRTVGMAVSDFLFRYETIDTSKIPKNKYSFVEHKEVFEDAPQMTILNSIFLKKRYYVRSNYHNKNVYYQLERTPV